MTNEKKPEAPKPEAPKIDGEIDGVQTPNPISDPSQSEPKQS